MIPKIKKILYASDLSENARHAFNYAAVMANTFDAKISILNVLEDYANNSASLYLGEERWQEIQETNRQEVLDAIRDRLDSFCGEMQENMESCPFIVGEIIVTQGQPVDEILHHAETGGHDLVVMGTHGYGVLADVLMGSTARRVVRRCKIPVLVVRLPDDGDDET